MAGGSRKVLKDWPSIARFNFLIFIRLHLFFPRERLDLSNRVKV
jgi:hypothetical protein